jgi:hypothetical protein
LSPLADNVNQGRLVGVIVQATAGIQAGVFAAAKGMFTGYDCKPIVTNWEIGGGVLKYTVVTLQITVIVNKRVTDGTVR